MKRSRKKRYSRCRICNKFTQMTKEHVPPKSAFNDRGYLEYYKVQTEKAELMQWATREVNQTGMFVFTLCKKCNNKTGRAYGNAYVDFVKRIVLIAKPENADADVLVELEAFPLRIVKQAISMILSTSNPTAFQGYEAVANPFPSRQLVEFGKRPDQTELSEKYQQLRDFVRKRDSQVLPASVRLYVYATVNSGSGVHTGILGAGTLSTQRMFWGVVVGLWPIQWVLGLAGEPPEHLLDVTDWANETYKQKRKLKFNIPCRWTFAQYPLDFRSPEKHMRDGFVSRMRYEGYLPDPDVDEEKRFAGAIEFARRRGKTTTERLFLRQFSLGTYAEYRGRRLWFEGKRMTEVQRFLESDEAKNAFEE